VLFVCHSEPSAKIPAFVSYPLKPKQLDRHARACRPPTPKILSSPQTPHLRIRKTIDLAFPVSSAAYNLNRVPRLRFLCVLAMAGKQSIEIQYIDTSNCFQIAATDLLQSINQK